MSEERPSPSSDINLKTFEKKISVRQLGLQDFDRIVALQLRCFPKMEPWTLDQYESLIKIFPEGQLCVEVEGTIVGSTSSLIVDFDLYSDWHDWMLISGGGYIRNHNPNGDALYGIEIMVDPEYRGMRLARRLYEARKALCRTYNLQRMVIGGRIPGYVQYKDEMSAREYAESVMDRTLYDPVLTTQLANGFVLNRLIPDYLPSDEDSAGYATHMEWINLACSVDSNECHLRKAAEVNIPQFIQVDVAQKKVDTIGPEKRSAPIQHLQKFDTGIAIQGGQIGRSWSMVIAKETGKMSASVVDNGVGFVIFWACTPKS